MASMPMLSPPEGIMKKIMEMQNKKIQEALKRYQDKHGHPYDPTTGTPLEGVELSHEELNQFMTAPENQGMIKV